MTTIIPFQTIDWCGIDKTIHGGKTGTSFWQTLQLPGLRLRIVEYSSGYQADHWCAKGHIVYCISGSFVSELATGERFTLTAGMVYVVSDDASTHRSVTNEGATLLIIDGNFLQGSKK